MAGNFAVFVLLNGLKLKRLAAVSQEQRRRQKLPNTDIDTSYNGTVKDKAGNHDPSAQCRTTTTSVTGLSLHDKQTLGRPDQFDCNRPGVIEGLPRSLHATTSLGSAL